MQSKRVAQEAGGFQYLKLADEIEQKVLAGGYKSGEKLPSLRSVQARTGLSITTIYRAYQELEDRGVVDPREKSGFFVRSQIRNILPLPGFKRHNPQPKQVRVNMLVDAVMEALSDTSMLHMGAAVPAPELLPLKQLRASTKNAASIYAKHGGIGYGPPDGIPEIRRQISNRVLGYGDRVDMDEIVITNGCMDAIQLCLQAVANPGDTILVESPTFTCYLQLIEDLKMLVLEVPTSPEFGLDFDSLEKAVTEHDVKACILNPNFQNPLGFEMREEAKRKVVQFMGKKSIPIIEDDIYGELYFGAARPKPLKSFDRDGLVLYCSSFSKSLAPDLRVGWAMPGRFIERVRRLKFNTRIASSKLNQLIVSDYIEGGSYDRHLRRLRIALKSQTLNTALAIARHFPRGTKISAPGGGLILWVQMDERIDGMKLFFEARDQNIFVLPGLISSSTDHYRNCIRVSCGNLWNERVEAGIRTLGQIAARQI